MSILRPPSERAKTYKFASDKGVFSYRCAACGAENLCLHIVRASGASDEYNSLGRDPYQSYAADIAQTRAQEHLKAEDWLLFYDFNKEHRYDSLSDAVHCPKCGAKQPWSGIPRPWDESKSFTGWKRIGLAVLFFVGVEVFNYVSRRELPMLGFLVAAVALVAVWPAVYAIRRRFALSALKKATFDPPVYYNRENLDELLSGPRGEEAAALLDEYEYR